MAEQLTLSDVKELMDWLDGRSKERHSELREKLQGIEEDMAPLIADKERRDYMKSWIKPIMITVVAGLILGAVTTYVS